MLFSQKFAHVNFGTNRAKLTGQPERWSSKWCDRIWCLKKQCMLQQCIIPKIHNLCKIFVLRFYGKEFSLKTLNRLERICFLLCSFVIELQFCFFYCSRILTRIWNEYTEHQNYIRSNSFWKHLSDDGILATFQKQQKCNAFHLESWYLLRKVFFR